jgi:hypothetical protein
MDEDAGRWMTYDEIAAARGTTKRAAVMLVRRHKWRRQKDNEGHTRALVPATWTDNAEAKGGDNGSGNSDRYSDRYSGRAIEALEGALVALQEAHARELVVLREAHQSEVAGLRDQLRADRERLEFELRMAIAAHQEAQQAADELRRSDEARQARGLLARLRAAWRGE